MRLSQGRAAPAGTGVSVTLELRAVCGVTDTGRAFGNSFGNSFGNTLSESGPLFRALGCS